MIKNNSIIVTLFMLTPIVYAGQEGLYKSVAINQDAAVVEVHANTDKTALWYNVGYYSPDDNNGAGGIHWKKNEKIPVTPNDKLPWSSVAVCGDDVVVIFPGKSGTDIWSITGKFTYPQGGGVQHELRLATATRRYCLGKFN